MIQYNNIVHQISNQLRNHLGNAADDIGFCGCDIMGDDGQYHHIIFKTEHCSRQFHDDDAMKMILIDWDGKYDKHNPNLDAVMESSLII